MDDPGVADAVAEAMQDAWILIADGHHRYETALAYRDELRAAGAGDGPHDRVLMGLTALDDPGLVVLPTHRLLTRWPEGADAAFTSTPVRRPRRAPGRPGRRAGGRSRPRPGHAAAARPC